MVKKAEMNMVPFYITVVVCITLLGLGLVYISSDRHYMSAEKLKQERQKAFHEGVAVGMDHSCLNQMHEAYELFAQNCLLVIVNGSKPEMGSWYRNNNISQFNESLAHTIDYWNLEQDQIYGYTDQLFDIGQTYWVICDD